MESQALDHLPPLDAFATTAALRGGRSRRVVHGGRLHRPFRTVRTARPPRTQLELADAYLPKMAEHEFFSHATAALIHRLRLPLDLELRMAVDVSVHKPHRAPRDPRVLGHHLVERPGIVVLRSGKRVANVIETLCQLATVLPDDDLVAAAETVLPPRRPSGDVALDRIRSAFADERRPYSAKLARVAPRIRIGARSTWETRARLLLIDAGLPEPELNLLWTGPDGGTTEGDLVYRAQRVWIEIEGDQHRTDRRQWRKDLRRYERLADLGWRVIRLSAEDIRDHPLETVALVRRALAGR